MSFLQSIILSFIQGITEFLPISSDGHLNLFQYFFGLTPSLSFDIFLHAATFLSVLFFFRYQIKYFFSNLKYIVVGSIPAIIVGFFFKDQIESLFASPKLLPLFFLITGSLVLATRSLTKKNKPLTYFSAFIIGIFQALAILPGVSRSGCTIFAALLLGLSPLNAFNFSFSLFIPATAGAILLDIKNILRPNILTPTNLISFIITFIVGFFALKFLKKIITDDKFWIFGIYVITLAIGLFIYYLAHTRLPL
jgi:undecaprenyl-diphosphatase